MADSKQKLRVVIVGGSIAGLTLAHCLIKHGIDFVVLEARDEIAPYEGASISVMALAGLALDQLGIMDDILEESDPVQDLYNYDADGKLICYLDIPKRFTEWFAYGSVFLPRQTLLRILYKHLREQQSSVFTGKKATDVDHHDGGVMVRCADGSSFQGDIVVGADGVRSQVRQKMWSHMDTIGMGMEAQADRDLMTCQWSCVFGIASPVPGTKSPGYYRTYGEGWHILVVVGKYDKVYWFFFKNLDRLYEAHEIPRFKNEDIEAHITPYLGATVHGSVKLGDIWKRVEATAWVPIEEALHEHWSVDRFACIGDAAHKMTPNGGLGGNTAIESAVSISNAIAAIQRSGKKQNKEIGQALKEWEKHRKDRLVAHYKAAADNVRLDTLAEPKHKVLLKYMGILGPIAAISRSVLTAGAERVNCLPPPAKSYQGTMPYKCHDDLTRVVKEKKSKRALWSLPLLGFTAVGVSTMGVIMPKVLPDFISLMKQGTWVLNTDSIVSLSAPILGYKSLDDFLRIFTTFFLPSLTGADPVSQSQAFTFLVDATGIFGIWLLESYRKAHTKTAPLLPILMASLAQLRGMGIIGPIYSALQYLSISIEDMAGNHKREIEPTTTYTLLASSLIAQGVPCLASFLAPSLSDRRWWNAIWQLFPVLVPLVQIPLKMVLSNQNTESASLEIRKENRQRSIKSIRVAYCSFAAVSALGFLYARNIAPGGSSAMSLFWPGWIKPEGLSLMDGLRKFLQWDQMLTMGSGFVWLALRFRELKKSGVQFSAWKGALGLIGTTCAFGPGTAFALGWGWKEELLHKLNVSLRL